LKEALARRMIENNKKPKKPTKEELKKMK